MHGKYKETAGRAPEVATRQRLDKQVSLGAAPGAEVVAAVMESSQIRLEDVAQSLG